jgi:hypothetical protein
VPVCRKKTAQLRRIRRSISFVLDEAPGCGDLAAQRSRFIVYPLQESAMHPLSLSFAFLRAGCAAAFLALASAGAAAASRPIVTESIDEPGRTPYQENRQNLCGLSQGCEIVYSAVPAGVRRIVDRISCEGLTDTANSVSFLSLLPYDGAALRAFIPVTTGPLAKEFLVNTATQIYFDTGDTPTVFGLPIELSGAAITSLECTLVGHDIALP